MKRLLSSLLLGATILASGCGQKHKYTHAEYNGRFGGYGVKIMQSSNDVIYDKMVALNGHDNNLKCTNEYTFVLGRYYSPTGEVCDIEAERAESPIGMIRFTKFTDFSDPMFGKSDKREFDKLKALLENAEREVRK